MSLRICQVSLSDINRDTRILRTVAALESKGYKVTPIGRDDNRPVVAMTKARKLVIAMRQWPARFLPSAWSHAVYWSIGEHRTLYHRLLASKADIIHAHDWEVLPLAAQAARQLNARLIYESHEYAVGQRLHRRFWRWVFPAYIHQLEALNIHMADAVITISNSLGRLMQQNYGLERAPVTIRSTPFYEATSHRTPDPSRILVHYHGIFTQGRGLRALIRSVALWPIAYHLRLVGWGQPPSFECELREIVEKLGLSERVHFVSRIANEKLIREISDADIGICFWDDQHLQLRNALPNKIFEYGMAGLMVLCGPGIELNALVDDHGHGLCLPDNQPETLAQTLRALKPEEIGRYKAKSLEAAHTLCWEKEKDKLLAIYENCSEMLTVNSRT